MSLTLEQAVIELAEFATNLDETRLEAPWKWISYDNEGIRFAFFRVMEELRALAVRLAHHRQTNGKPPSDSQRILAQYHAAFRDLQAVTLGLDEAGFTRLPGQDEWPVRKTLAHILNAEMGFSVAVRYCLERQRSGDGRPERIPEEAWGPLIGLSEAQYEALMDSSAPTILAFLAKEHGRILMDFSGIQDEELDLSSYYWEELPHPLRFRLHRFESHMRQHTIQIEKTLAMLGRPLSEPLRLMRIVFAALAEVEGAAIGEGSMSSGLAEETASLIDGWVGEIKSAAAA